MKVEEAQAEITRMVYAGPIEHKLVAGFEAFLKEFSLGPLSPRERQRMLTVYTFGYMDAYEESTKQCVAVQKLKREVAGEFRR